MLGARRAKYEEATKAWNIHMVRGQFSAQRDESLDRSLTLSEQEDVRRLVAGLT